MNQKLKIVEGARVCTNASDDTYIVEGAWGTSVCALESKGYALAKDTKVKVVLDSAYVEVGQTGKIYRTDYRSALPYEVIMDKGDCVWVAGCTIQNVDTEVYIEEYSADVEDEVSPDEDILENGFSRQVTFYEKD